jgi:DNA polymerase V
MSPLIFGLVDCNNFYASCERAFRPALNGKPIIVLSNNDGCVIARSNEAKELGFKMGDPFHHNRDKIRKHRVAVFSSNYTLYGDMSRRVMDTLETAAPAIEVYSIDEAFLDLTGIPTPMRDDFARQIRAQVRRDTGIPVSIGIGPTKTLAKLANRLAKKHAGQNGVFDLTAGQDLDEVLHSVEVGDVWGVGRQWATWLNEQKIITALDLKRADPKAMRRRMTVVGERIVHELRGTSCMPLELIAPQQQGITVSRSFGALQEDLAAIDQALTLFVGRAAEKLREQGLMTEKITVFASSNRFDTKSAFYSKSASLALPFPTDHTPELLHYGLALLRQIYKPGVRYIKAGIMLLELSPAVREKRNLLDDRDQARQAALMTAMDALNQRYGRRTLQFGDTGMLNQKRAGWSARADMLSPKYTTAWDQLARVR